jgi:Mrp family chromosome partitioning ATPase
MSIGFLLDDRDTPTIWRGPLRAGVIRQFIADVAWGKLDYLIVDLPPGTGDEPLTVAQSFPQAEGALVITTPQEASLADCRKAINFVRAVKLPVLGVIENMSGFVCPHCGEVSDVFGAGGGEAMAQEMGVPFLGRLPLAPEVVSLCDQGRPLLGAEAPAAVREAFAGIVEVLVSTIAGDNGGA